MKKRDLKIVVPTCDKYMHLIEGYIYTLDKYWENHGDVILLGYKEPQFELKSHTEFISLGVDKGAQVWSNGLIDFFKDFDEEFFIFMNDDALLTDYVNDATIEYFYQMMLKNNKIGKASLYGSLGDNPKYYVPLQDNNYSNLISINQNADYRTSLQPAIWRTDLFRKWLRPNISPWDFELSHFKNDGIIILSTNKYQPLYLSHLFRRNNVLVNDWWYRSKHNNSSLSEEDKQYLIKLLKLPV